MVTNEVAHVTKKIKAFKVNEVTENLIEMFEIIYTEKAKSKAFRYNIEHNDNLFQYQKYEEYYTKIFTDLINNHFYSFDNLKKIVPDFEHEIEYNKLYRTKTLELKSSTVSTINEYIKENDLKAQEFILLALERTIIRNKLNIDYLRNLYQKVNANVD